MSTISDEAVAVAKVALGELGPDVTDDEMRAALEATLPHLVPQWRPIESAPKDTPIIVSDGDFVCEATLAYSNDGQLEWWRTNKLTPMVKDPTHWQPLPEPPKEGE